MHKNRTNEDSWSISTHINSKLLILEENLDWLRNETKFIARDCL